MLKKILYSIYVVMVPLFFIFIISGIIYEQIKTEVSISFNAELYIIYYVISNLLFGVVFAHILILKPKKIKKRHDAALYFIMAFYLLYLILDYFIFNLLFIPEATGYMLILFALYIFKAIKICITKDKATADIQ